VAIRIGEDPWTEVEGHDLASVQKEYDEGLIELAQGRVEGGFALYRIPRRRPVKPRAWFSDEVPAVAA
jgi:hypothetical protein